MEDFWGRFLGLISGKLDSRAFEAWIKPISFSRLENDTLFINVPDSFFKDWLEDNYSPVIKEVALELTGKEVVLIVGTNFSPSIKPGVIQSRRPSPPVFSSSNIRSKYTFDDFVVGSSNQFAHAASFAVANNPAYNYNPLFLFGGVGLGKTHLLNAIGHHVLKNNVRSKVCYISSEQFTNELINSLRYQKMSSFREKFRTLEVLLIDDIQFIAGKERTQEEFFHTFNSLYETHQQIVLTCDAPPKDIHSLEERLRSRFEWGLMADIQPPETETKVAILKQCSLSENIQLPNDVAFFLASNVRSNIRELEGMLTRVAAFSSLNRCEITLDLAKEVLKDLIKSSGEGVVDITTIQKVVSNHFKISLSDLKSKRKQKNIVFPRQVCMYLARNLTKMSFPEIAARFGGKDHSTVIYSVNKIKSSLVLDKQLKNSIDTLISKLTQ